MWNLRRRAKSSFGYLLYHAELHRAFWRQRALIVVFHRVDDRFPHDPLSCSVARFHAYCDFFQRHFIVVSLGTLLEKLARGQDISRHLVITFDDGYRDNLVIAAPELRKRGLPACFFITTGYIGSSENAWWDTYRNVASEWMTWDDVRALHAQGFEVGLHTANHVDLGVIVDEQAADEIVAPKAQYERELGIPARFFCYPFGREWQITDENRALVRQSGYSCCLSAYGGTVRPGDDPFRLKRTTAADTWYGEPYHFGLEVGWASR